MNHLLEGKLLVVWCAGVWWSVMTRWHTVHRQLCSVCSLYISVPVKMRMRWLVTAAVVVCQRCLWWNSANFTALLCWRRNRSNHHLAQTCSLRCFFLLLFDNVTVTWRWSNLAKVALNLYFTTGKISPHKPWLAPHHKWRDQDPLLMQCVSAPSQTTAESIQPFLHSTAELRDRQSRFAFDVPKSNHKWCSIWHISLNSNEIILFKLEFGLVMVMLDQMDSVVTLQNLRDYAKLII